MQPDWEYVKKTTLWHYEDLLKKLSFVTGYPVLWRAYNHDMSRAADFARRLFPGSNIAVGDYPALVIATIGCLERSGISSWGDLLEMVATREDCAAFIADNNLEFEELMDVLNYLLRWGFPFQTASRELLDHDNPQEMGFYEKLKCHRLMYTFDILEQGHTAQGRRDLAEHTGLLPDFVTGLAHRADIARLPYVRRKTLLPLCGAGYDTLARIAAADPSRMEADLDTYFRRTQGKSWKNYQAVIDLKGMAAWARTLPVILET